MGGYGSTRWAWTATRTTTTEALRLDVRELARRGALQPGVRSEIRWMRADALFAAITLHAQSDWVSLDYRIANPGGRDDRLVQEIVPLAFTACRYGGTRPWFRCLDCHQRRAVLYGIGGRFRCAACQHLAYRSTRESAADRLIRRAAVLRRTLSDAPDSGSLPAKPKGMHGRTYRRLTATIAACEQAAAALLVPRAEELVARCNQYVERG